MLHVLSRFTECVILYSFRNLEVLKEDLNTPLPESLGGLTYLAYLFVFNEIFLSLTHRLFKFRNLLGVGFSGDLPFVVFEKLVNLVEL